MKGLIEARAQEVEEALCVHAFWGRTRMWKSALHRSRVTTWCEPTNVLPLAHVTSDHTRVTCVACRQALINAGLLPGEMWV